MRNLNFGCGGNILPGWENHDADVDISKPLPYENNSIDQVFAEHVAEHIHPHKFLGFLDECRRILKPGGRIRICMPVLERLDPEAARDIILNHGHEAAYSTQLIMDFLRAAGFSGIKQTQRKPIDGHFRVIGRSKDDLETARIEAIKP